MKEQISKYYIGSRRLAQVSFELDFEEMQEQGYKVSMQEWGDGSWGIAAWLNTSTFLVLPLPIMLFIGFDGASDVLQNVIMVLGGLNVIGVFSFLYLLICKPVGLLGVIYEKEVISKP